MSTFEHLAAAIARPSGNCGKDKVVGNGQIGELGLLEHSKARLSGLEVCGLVAFQVMASAFAASRSGRPGAGGDAAAFIPIGMAEPEKLLHSRDPGTRVGDSRFHKQPSHQFARKPVSTGLPQPHPAQFITQPNQVIACGVMAPPVALHTRTVTTPVALTLEDQVKPAPSSAPGEKNAAVPATALGTDRV